jgi:ubiquinone/menaquinone biosynthesis C-methylase UbiE
VSPKPYLGVQMEGPIAAWYDRSTRGRIPEFQHTADEIASFLPRGSDVLEVAPGPGLLAIELAKRGHRVTGLDISRSFVRIAARNAEAAGVSVDVVLGDVAHLPFADGSFDFVVCVAAFKNFPDPGGALDEMHRVLRPGGAAWIQDMRKDATAADVDAEVASMRLGRARSVLMRWIFRSVLMRAAYRLPTVKDLARRSAFGNGQIATRGVGFELRLVKR